MRMIVFSAIYITNSEYKIVVLAGTCNGTGDPNLSEDLVSYVFQNYTASMIPLCQANQPVELHLNIALRQIIDMVSLSLCVFMLFLARFRLLSVHIWEIAAHSVDHMFSLYFDYL